MSDLGLSLGDVWSAKSTLKAPKGWIAADRVKLHPRNTFLLVFVDMFREEPYTDMQDLLSKDRIASLLGVRMLEWGPGKCRLEMVVDERMLNAYGSCHGSAIFALADIAFAVCCNSGGVKSVALSMNINYRRPARQGDRLIAEAREESAGSTTALCRIRIANGDGKIVALADGLAYRIRT